MHHPRRTSPVTNRPRCRTAAVVTAVVLALLAALCAAGPTGTTSGQVINSTATMGDHRDAGPRADDMCDTACAVPAATRHTAHGEHPTPRNHLTPAPGDGTVIAPPQPAPHQATARRITSPEPPPSPDRDRAPPLPSGI
jgi:hypothetical protein